MVLTQHGVSVVAVDIDEEAGRKIVEVDSDHIVFLNGDVSEESVAKEAVQMAIDKFGKLTGLVNNTHASRQRPLMELTEEDWSLKRIEEKLPL